MFDLGWTELAVVALVALIVIGPKDLPRAMRTVGQYARKLRGMAREFQSGLDEMVREAELDEAKKSIEGARNLTNPKKLLTDSIDPTGEMEKDAADLEQEARAAAKGEDRVSTASTKAAGEKLSKAGAKPTGEAAAEEPAKAPKATAKAAAEEPKAREESA